MTGREDLSLRALVADFGGARAVGTFLAGALLWLVAAGLVGWLADQRRHGT